MASLVNQQRVFDFLCAHYDSQDRFTKDDLRAATTWSRSALDTYCSKQLRPFVREIAPGIYRVSEAFRRYSTWEVFRQHVTQVRAITATDYTHRKYENVLVYEFFMPLTNETELRSTLDALFYKDTLLRKLKACELADIRGQVPKARGELKKAYLDRVCTWIAKRFVGYSISHVTGRFRALDLCSRAEAAEVEQRQRYLIDETTAITRFIFPCDNEAEANQVRWFFNKLFVDSIIEVVNGEDEIWMVESGMRNLLHIWKVDSPA